MLTRKCGVRELLRVGDYNVRVTVISKPKGRYIQKSLADGAWKEAFRDSLGGGIINDSKTEYLVICETPDKKIEFNSKGAEIIDFCWRYLQDVDIARLDLTKLPGNTKKPHSWIIMRVEE